MRNVEDLVPRSRIEQVDRAAACDSRGVHHAIEAARLGHDCRHRVLDGSLVAYVESQKTQATLAIFARLLGRRSGSDIRPVDVCSLSYEAFRTGLTDARRGTRHKRNPSREPFPHNSLPLLCAVQIN